MGRTRFYHSTPRMSSKSLSLLEAVLLVACEHMRGISTCLFFYSITASHVMPTMSRPEPYQQQEATLGNGTYKGLLASEIE